MWEFKTLHKGKTTDLHLQNRSRKFCRINGENPDKIGVFTGYIYFVALLWQGHKDLNPEPTVLETAALPIELYPYIARTLRWWAFGDSNPGPSGYEPDALTN